MFTQYRPQRHRIRTLPNGRAVQVGTMEIGSIFRASNGRKNASYIIEAWHNREYYPCTASRPRTIFMVGGHLATVRNLGTGERSQLADHHIMRLLDA